MFDIWMEDIDLTLLIMIFSMVIILPLQLLLCFKAKSRIIRFIPIIALFILAVIEIIKYATATAWDGLFFVVVVMYEAFMLFMCGIGWGIWAFVNAVKKADSKK